MLEVEESLLEFSPILLLAFKVVSCNSMLSFKPDISLIDFKLRLVLSEFDDIILAVCNAMENGLPSDLAANVSSVSI